MISFERITDNNPLLTHFMILFKNKIIDEYGDTDIEYSVFENILYNELGFIKRDITDMWEHWQKEIGA